MMTLKNGKFYQDGQPIPLEFGNMEQIALMDYAKSLQEEGVLPELIYDPTDKFICGISIQCPCGETIKVECETEDEMEVIEGHRLKCTGCDYLYEVCSDDCCFYFFKIYNEKPKKKAKR